MSNQKISQLPEGDPINVVADIIEVSQKQPNGTYKSIQVPIGMLSSGEKLLGTIKADLNIALLNYWELHCGGVCTGLQLNHVYTGSISGATFKFTAQLFSPNPNFYVVVPVILSGTPQANDQLSNGMTITSLIYLVPPDQPITLSGGSKYYISKILFVNPSGNVTVAADAQINTQTYRTGFTIASTSESQFSNDLLSLLTSTGSVLDMYWANAMYYAEGVIETTGSIVYLSVGTPQGAPMNADIWIIGYVIQ